MCIKQKHGGSYFNTAFGKTLFKTFEEAQIETHKRTAIKKKRELLKKYERKLNEELKLENHFIIK